MAKTARLLSWFASSDDAFAYSFGSMTRSGKQHPARWLCGSCAGLYLLGAAICFVINLTFATAEDSSNPGKLLRFDIPAQSLTDALQTYSKISGVQIMFETNSAHGYQSSVVKGDLLPEAALQVLLAKTDLRVRYTRANAVTLAPPSDPGVDEPPEHPLISAGAPDITLDILRVRGLTEPPPDATRLNAYISGVQADIQNALKKTTKMHGRDNRAGIMLWIDQSRIVQRAELFRSTGNHDNDVFIASALHGLIVSQQAPANTPQPIRFMIQIRTF
jgi:hypothetical protein